jgi:putative transposase
VDNWARTTARDLVARAEVIALEDLNLLGMTRSAAGTIENPGTNVAAKAGLNRALQDVALGRLARWVGVKAEEAGRRTWLVDPAHTSQRCHPCGHTAKENRPDRDTFTCTRCGHQAHADINAAENVADRAQACEAAWREAGRPVLYRPGPRLLRRTGSAAKAGSDKNTQHHRGRVGSEATIHGGRTQK